MTNRERRQLKQGTRATIVTEPSEYEYVAEGCLDKLNRILVRGYSFVQDLLKTAFPKDTESLYINSHPLRHSGLEVVPSSPTKQRKAKQILATKNSTTSSTFPKQLFSPSTIQNAALQPLHHLRPRHNGHGPPSRRECRQCPCRTAQRRG